MRDHEKKLHPEHPKRPEHPAHPEHPHRSDERPDEPECPPVPPPPPLPPSAPDEQPEPLTPKPPEPARHHHDVIQSGLAAFGDDVVVIVRPDDQDVITSTGVNLLLGAVAGGRPATQKARPWIESRDAAQDPRPDTKLHAGLLMLDEDSVVIVFRNDELQPDLTAALREARSESINWGLVQRGRAWPEIRL